MGGPCYNMRCITSRTCHLFYSGHCACGERYDLGTTIGMIFEGISIRSWPCCKEFDLAWDAKLLQRSEIG